MPLKQKSGVTPEHRGDRHRHMAFRPQGAVVMKATPASLFIMIQAELALQLLIAPLDTPAHHGEAHQLRDGRVEWHRHADDIAETLPGRLFTPSGHDAVAGIREDGVARNPLALQAADPLRGSVPWFGRPRPQERWRRRSAAHDSRKYNV